jgi:hypothetical protein
VVLAFTTKVQILLHQSACIGQVCGNTGVTH